ncbi:MAG TPA: VOC family protein [Candidatus Baltobacteraceae bacterium]|nr:VOC family protein [Candidatus Baltobacteraceae bacterium]
MNDFSPYLFFYGRCEEALEFYKSVFGGSFEIQRHGDTPMGEQSPEGWSDKVMHAKFTAPGIKFMASDGGSEKAVDPDSGNIALSIETGDAGEAERVFGALAEGGTVMMPLSAVPWGGRFGVLHDRFGTEWMLSAP